MKSPFFLLSTYPRFPLVQSHRGTLPQRCRWKVSAPARAENQRNKPCGLTQGIWKLPTGWLFWYYFTNKRCGFARKYDIWIYIYIYYIFLLVSCQTPSNRVVGTQTLEQFPKCWFGWNDTNNDEMNKITQQNQTIQNEMGMFYFFETEDFPLLPQPINSKVWCIIFVSKNMFEFARFTFIIPCPYS